MKALTRIKHNGEYYEVGSEVSKSSLKASDEEWEQLVATGAVGKELPDVAPAAGGYQKTSDMLETDLGEAGAPKAAPKEAEEK